jgi:hypothetical protein
MRFFFLFLITLFQISGCGRVIGKNLFSTKPDAEATENPEIRFKALFIGSYKIEEKILLKVFLFYRNGVALEYSLDPNKVIVNGEFDGHRIVSEIITTNDVYKNIKQAGGYEIVGNQIHIQIFEFVNYGSFELCSYKGEINNDSTIFITSCYIKSGSNFCPKNFVMKKLKTLDLDSTHQLMKKNGIGKIKKNRK